MNREFGVIILIGLVIGSLLGTAFGASADNGMVAVGVGALAGLFIGWFVAAARQEAAKKPHS